MHTIFRSLALALILLAAQPAHALVGYVNTAFSASTYSLFCNPLQTPTNKLSQLFGAGTPEGTTISLWDPISSSYTTSATYEAGLWSNDLTLNLGTGARLYAPATFTNTFVGEVLGRDGGPYTEPTPPAPLFGGPPGMYLFGDKNPATSTGTNVFLNVVGRLPFVGEQFIDGVSGTSTYLGGGVWSGANPTLSPGESAFYNLGNVSAVPEPSTTSLALLGLGLLRLWRRPRR